MSGSEGGVPRAADGGKRHRVARTAAGVGRVLISAGVLLLLFVGYQLWGTGLSEAHAQQNLTKNYEQRLQSVHGASTPTTDSGADSSTVQPPPGVPAASNGPAPKIGDPIGQIDIPKIHVRKTVVEGISDDELHRGPGHYPTTPLPGQKGNSAIAGHRSTYGAPFANVDQLGPGDKIIVTTPQGTFTYEVMAAPLIVKPSEVSVLDDFGDNRLTLTACHPKYSATERIIIQAKLIGLPVAALSGQTKAGAFHASLGMSWRRYLPLVWWGLACAAIWAITWTASKLLDRRGIGWRRWAPYIAGVPVFLLSLWVLFGLVANLLPSNY
ncbi:MAG: class E sortase [Acidimicrobiales bacterium]